MDILNLKCCSQRIAHFLNNSSIERLDIGRNVILVCIVSPNDPTNPKLYECHYQVYYFNKASSSWPFKYFYKSEANKNFQNFDITTDTIFCREWNKNFNIYTFVNAEADENPEMVGMLTEPIENNVLEQDVPKVESEQQNLPEISAFQPIDTASYQLMHMSLLQQISMLQSQLCMSNNALHFQNAHNRCIGSQEHYNAPQPLKIEKPKFVSVAVNTSFAIMNPMEAKSSMKSAETNTTIIKHDDIESSRLESDMHSEIKIAEITRLNQNDGALQSMKF